MFLNTHDGSDYVRFKPGTCRDHDVWRRQSQGVHVPDSFCVTGACMKVVKLHMGLLWGVGMTMSLIAVGLTVCAKSLHDYRIFLLM